MKAAVLHEVGHPLILEELQLRSLRAYDVLVRIRAAGLCHTDLEVIQGDIQRPLPIVLGHEGAGIVEDVGAEVTRVRKGDHVVCSGIPNCGRCFYCDLGHPALCEVLAAGLRAGTLPDGESRLILRGRAVHHFAFISAFGEYCVIPEAGAVPVPPEIDFDRACLLGCCVLTGIAAVTRCAQVRPGTSVLVVGCGAIGLNVIQGARLAAARSIIALDVNAHRLPMALAFGATHTIDAARQDPVTAVRGLTHGRGADYAFEAAGNEAALRTTLEAARPGARIVILGKTPVDARVSLRFGSLIGEKSIIRAAYGGGRPRVDIPWLAAAYLEGRVRLDELITRRLPLAQINEGFQEMQRAAVVRALVIT